MAGLTCIITLLCVFTSQTDSARILAILPVPSLSHQIVFRPLINELVKNGHELVVVTPDPEYSNENRPANLTEIDVHGISYKAFREYLLSNVMTHTGEVVDQIKGIYMALVSVFDEQLKVPAVRDIILKKKGHFDLLITENVYISALAFSHVYKVPLVQISSFGPIAFNDHYVGALTHPILFPLPWHRKVYNLTLWERMKKIWDHYSFKYYYNNVIGAYENEVVQKHFGFNVPSVHDLCKNIHLLILDVHPLWIDNQPVSPNVVFVNGIHQKPPKELPKDLKSYMDSSKNGVIYVSFGTNVIPSAFQADKLHVLLKVLSQLPYDVIFKWDKDKLPIEAKNIKTAKWLPQADILRHPKVKLFIMQGGLQSMDEALTAGIPMIGIPVLSDQWYNTDKFEYHKIGIRIDMEDLSEKKFKDAIDTIIRDDSYRTNVVRFNALIQDQPQPPLERAVWWIEHLLRHGGGPHLRPPTANMSLAEFIQLDLIVAALCIICSTIILVVFGVRALWKSFTPHKSKKVKKS